MSQDGGLSLSDIFKLYIVRGMEGESQIQESWADILASRHRVRMREWLGAMAGLAGTFLGLALVGVPVALAGGKTSALDVLFAGTVVGLACLAAWAATAWVMRYRAPAARALVAGVAASLALVALVAGVLAWGGAPGWMAAFAVAGASVAVPSLGLAYNQLVDIVDPMGWTSAFERRMAPLMEEMVRQDQQPRVVERPVIRWAHHANRRDRLTAREALLPGEEEDGDDVEVPAQDDLDLADWLEEARTRGLARREWLRPGHARHVLPTTGRRVTRPTYDRMVELAAEQGYVRRGGDGEATGWAMEPDDAYDDWCGLLEDEWGDLLDRAA